MKTLIVLVAIVAAASAVRLSASEVAGHWHGFKATHGKVYASPVEEKFRMKIFADNLQRVNAHNARFDQGLETFKVGVNEYSDMVSMLSIRVVVLSLKTLSSVARTLKGRDMIVGACALGQRVSDVVYARTSKFPLS